jgi:PIN domain nuclease of toxin-antitoxin system
MATRLKSERYLIDTNVFIRLKEKSPLLGGDIVELLSDFSIEVYVSVVGIWEIIIKRGKTPLKVPRDVVKSISDSGMSILPIEATHAIEVEKLPYHHKDPFDRMLIAQARVEGLTLMTFDRMFEKYKLNLVKL